MLSLSSSEPSLNLADGYDSDQTPPDGGRGTLAKAGAALTPAQQYRQMLASMTDAEREIWRLELRWRKMKKEWHVAAVMVQSIIRTKQAKKRVAKKNAENNRIKLGDKLVNRAADALNDGDLELALSETANALELEPSFSHPHRIRGHTFFKLGEFEPAVEEYSLLLAVEPECRECLMGRAKACTLLARWDRALDDLEKLIDLESESRDLLTYYYMRGLVHSKLKMWREAVEDFSQCLSKGPRTPKAFMQRALAYAGDQQYQNAVQDLAAAIRISPTPELYCHRGRAHCCLRQWDQATVDFNQAIRMDPHCKDAKDGLRTVLTPHDPFPLQKAAS